MRRVFLFFMALTMPFMAYGMRFDDSLPSKEAKDLNACRGCAPSNPATLPNAAQIFQQIINGGMFSDPSVAVEVLTQIFSNPAAIQLIEQIGVRGLSDYAYIYNTEIIGFIESGASFPFSANGEITSGFTHTPGSTDLIVLKNGVYKIDFFSNITDGSNTIALFVNDVMVPGTIFSVFSNQTPNPGQVIVRLTAGDVITLKTAYDVVSEASGYTNAFISALKLN